MLLLFHLRVKYKTTCYTAAIMEREDLLHVVIAHGSFLNQASFNHTFEQFFDCSLSFLDRSRLECIIRYKGIACIIDLFHTAEVSRCYRAFGNLSPSVSGLFHAYLRSSSMRGERRCSREYTFQGSSNWAFMHRNEQRVALYYWGAEKCDSRPPFVLLCVRYCKVIVWGFGWKSHLIHPIEARLSKYC